MSAPSLARDNRGACFQVTAPPVEAADVISASVGEGGINKPDDVRTVQSLLNQVPVSDGGPDPPLDVDGVVGPKTNRAIAQFQLQQLGFEDSRVDPHGPTLRALHSEEVKPSFTGAPPASSLSVVPVPARRPRFKPDPDIVKLIEGLLPEIRSSIQAAIFHLDLVQPFVTTHKQKMPDGPFLSNVQFSLLLLDAVFGFFQFSNPQTVLVKLRRNFQNMNVALNRRFEVPALIAKTLFVPNPIAFMETKASAYTSAGGAFAPKGLKLTVGLPANQIYLCTNLKGQSRRDQVMTAIHELAHFVSPVVDPVTDPGSGFFFQNFPRMKALPARQKIHNAEHYAGYAFLAKNNALPE